MSACDVSSFGSISHSTVEYKLVGFRKSGVDVQRDGTSVDKETKKEGTKEMIDPACSRTTFPIDWRDTNACHWAIIALLSASLLTVATLAIVNRNDMKRQITEAKKEAFFQDLRKHMNEQIGEK